MAAKGAKNASFTEHSKMLAEAVKVMPHVLLVEGAEPFLRRCAINRVRDAILKKNPDAEEISFHGANSQSESGPGLGDLIGELSCSSLFSSRKIIIVRNGKLVLFPAKQSDSVSGKGKTADESFMEYVKNPSEDNWLLLEVDSVNKQRKLGKTLVAEVMSIPCPELRNQAEVARWLSTAASEQGKTIGRGVAEMLHQAHGGRLGALHSELDKLILFAGDRSEITTEDVELFLAGSMEFDTFGLTRSVEQRDLVEAISFARKVTHQGTRDRGGKRIDTAGSAHISLSLVSQTLEGMLAARAVATPGSDSVGELSSILKISPWQAERLIKASANYSISDLRAAMSKLAREAHSTHDTGGDALLSLEKSIIAICSRRPGRK